MPELRCILDDVFDDRLRRFLSIVRYCSDGSIMIGTWCSFSAVSVDRISGLIWLFVESLLKKEE